MVSRDLRLRKSFEFDRVRHRGRSWSSRILVLSILQNGTDQNRYGFAVGKKVGGSVERNRAKRVMREAIRSLHPQLTQGFDVVIIARNAFTLELKTQEIQSQLTMLAKRASLLRQGDSELAEPPMISANQPGNEA